MKQAKKKQTKSSEQAGSKVTEVKKEEVKVEESSKKKLPSSGTFKVTLKGSLRKNGVIYKPGDTLIVDKSLLNKLKEQGMA